MVPQEMAQQEMAPQAMMQQAEEDLHLRIHHHLITEGPLGADHLGDKDELRSVKVRSQ
jgi:hypothetical protein